MVAQDLSHGNMALGALLDRARAALAVERESDTAARRMAASAELRGELARLLGISVPRELVTIEPPTEIEAGIACVDYGHLRFYVGFGDERRQYLRPGLHVAVPCCDCTEWVWGLPVATLADVGRARELPRRCAACQAAWGEWWEGGEG